MASWLQHKQAVYDLLCKIGTWHQRRELWKAADVLISLGHDNGEMQIDINNAKNSIYEALSKLEG